MLQATWGERPPPGGLMLALALTLTLAQTLARISLALALTLTLTRTLSLTRTRTLTRRGGPRRVQAERGAGAPGEHHGRPQPPPMVAPRLGETG